MRILVIFVILTLCVVVRGWAAFLQPIALSIVAAFSALNIDLDADLIPTHWSWKARSKEEIDC